MRTNAVTSTSGEDYPTTMFSMSPQPIPSTKAHSPYYAPSEYPVSSCSGSPGRTAPIAIAPDPVGLRQINAMKRMRDEEDQYAEYGQKKRKRALSNVGPVELNEEEQLLLKLKEEENLPWKDIAVRFQNDLGKAYQVPALQMRFKRLRERMRTWTDVDVSIPALRISFFFFFSGIHLMVYRSKLLSKPTTTGRSFNLISLLQRYVSSLHELPFIFGPLDSFIHQY